ncbi:hypothetical protein EBT31_19830 [bacterium]|nr:hypothetical protein [bacterium]
MESGRTWNSLNILHKQAAGIQQEDTTATNRTTHKHQLQAAGILFPVIPVPRLQLVRPRLCNARPQLRQLQ